MANLIVANLIVANLIVANLICGANLTWPQCVNNFRYTDPMVDFEISVGAEENALQDCQLGFSMHRVTCGANLTRGANFI